MAYRKVPAIAIPTPRISMIEGNRCWIVQPIIRLPISFAMPTTLNCSLFSVWVISIYSKAIRLTVSADVAPIIRNCEMLNIAAHKPDANSATIF